MKPQPGQTLIEVGAFVVLIVLAIVLIIRFT